MRVGDIYLDKNAEWRTLFAVVEIGDTVRGVSYIKEDGDAFVRETTYSKKELESEKFRRVGQMDLSEVWIEAFYEGLEKKDFIIRYDKSGRRLHD